MARPDFVAKWYSYIFRDSTPTVPEYDGELMIDRDASGNKDEHKNPHSGVPGNPGEVKATFSDSVIIGGLTVRKIKFHVHPLGARYNYRGTKIPPSPYFGGLTDIEIFGTVKVKGRGKKEVDDPDEDATWVATSKPPGDFEGGDENGDDKGKDKNHRKSQMS